MDETLSSTLRLHVLPDQDGSPGPCLLYMCLSFVDFSVCVVSEVCDGKSVKGT